MFQYVRNASKGFNEITRAGDEWSDAAWWDGDFEPRIQRYTTLQVSSRNVELKSGRVKEMFRIVLGWKSGTAVWRTSITLWGSDADHPESLPSKELSDFAYFVAQANPHFLEDSKTIVNQKGQQETFYPGATGINVYALLYTTGVNGDFYQNNIAFFDVTGASALELDTGAQKGDERFRVEALAEKRYKKFREESRVNRIQPQLPPAEQPMYNTAGAGFAAPQSRVIDDEDIPF